MDFEGFYTQLCNTDWTYHYSDDASVYRAGEAQVNAILNSPETWKRDMANTYLGLNRVKDIAWESTGFGKRPIDYLIRLREMFADYEMPSSEAGLYVYNKFKDAIDSNYANGVTYEAVAHVTKLAIELATIYQAQFKSVDMDAFLRRHNVAIRKLDAGAHIKSRVSMDYIAVSEELYARAKELREYARKNPNVMQVWRQMNSSDTVVWYSDANTGYHVSATATNPPGIECDVTHVPHDVVVVGALLLFS